MARIGRRPGNPDTREAILAAARESFADRGFDRASIRAIATVARVDPALVHHYFGTKDRLFQEAIDLPSVASAIAEALAGAHGDVPEAIARLYIEHLFTERTLSFTALLRTALGSPGDVPELRRTVEQQIVGVATRALGGRDAPLRAELVAAQMIGVLVLRHLVGVEPIASTPTS